MSFSGNNILISTQKNNKIKYYIPTENEWYKAAFYDASLNNGSGGYWEYATRNNTQPSPVNANSVGDGLSGSFGNFANYNSQAIWNSVAGNVTSVGTNGASSYYGTFDQNGNVYEWTDTIIGSERIIRGGSWNNAGSVLLSSSRSSIPYETSTNSLGFRVATQIQIGLNNFVNITHTNINDITGYGSVNYIYQISKYLITNNEYVEFLNAIAQTDTYNLYNANMSSNSRGGISRFGISGNYSYQIKNNMGNKPVVFVTWFDCARYCNWLSNNKPSGPQGLASTEDGSYYLNGAINGTILKT